MRRLLDKVRRRGQKLEPGAGSAPPSIPRLPAPRPRPLTPDTWRGKHNSDHIAALGSFARLSPELRRRILEEAFGNRTLHLDLRLLPAGRAYTPTDLEHDGGAAPLSRSRLCAPDCTRLEWQWYGGVCHSQLPKDSQLAQNALAAGRSPYQWPHQDVCLEGQIGTCALWASSPSSCGSPERRAGCNASIGVMGWLSTCRQAYMEGVAVLYETNSFMLESRDLLDTLLNPSGLDDGHILPPQHLARIRSLELRLDVLLYGQLVHAGRIGPEPLPKLAGLISTFPGLRHLIISFLDTLYNDSSVRPTDRFPDLCELLFDPLSVAFAPLALARLKRPVIVELPENVFLDLFHNGDLAREVLGDQGSNGWGTWLRYPIHPNAATNTEANVTVSSPRGVSDGDSSSSPYFHIKQGAFSDVHWDQYSAPVSGRRDVNTCGHLVR